MSIEITHVRYDSAEHSARAVSHVKWFSITDWSVGFTRVDDLVSWMQQGGKVFVGSGPHRIRVGLAGIKSRLSGQHPDCESSHRLAQLPEF